MNSAFHDYFRCPEGAVQFAANEGRPQQSGYFRFGDGLTLYGGTSGIPVAKQVSPNLADTLPFARATGGEVSLPFDPDQVADCLRYERYAGGGDAGTARLGARPIIRDLYYLLRPLMPVPVRSILQRIHLRSQLNSSFPQWPVDRSVDRLFEKLMELALRANGNVAIPFIWFWPEGAKAACILTHDVETAAGVAFCPRLMDTDSEFGFRSAFQIVPEKRYEVTDSFLQQIKCRGFEVNVHDLNHDGNLFRERGEFLRRAEKINQYAVRFGTRGFRSGALYRQLDWYGDLDISYDMSVPNAGHLDPQGGGCCTVMPYFVGDILEIPVTEIQDYSLFHILNQYSIDLWKRQTEIIVGGNGMISLITHPDYLIPQKARSTYRELLGYLAETCKAQNVWATLPAEINRWWRMRHNMKLARVGDSWEVRGEGKERAKIAYASLVDGRLEYTFVPPSQERHPGSAVRAEGTLTNPVAAEAGRNSSPDLEQQFAEIVVSAREAAHSIVLDRGMQDEISYQSSSPPCSPSTPRPTKSQMPLTKPREVHQRATSMKGVAGEKQKLQRPLRVCMVAYTFYESDNRVMRYAETLAREGHEVEVYALQQADNPKKELLCGVTVYRIQRRLINERTLFSYVWRILSFLLRAFYQVSKNDLSRKYDLVHVHSVPDFLVFSALVPRLRGTPVILDIHDILPEFYAGKFGAKNDSIVFRFLCFTEWICARFASHVIIANHIWKERLEARSVEPAKCSVVLNSPDRSIFQRSLDHPAKSDRFILLYPGTLNQHQGLDIAIRAFAKIKDQVPFAVFHIYGEGPLKEQLSTLIKELALDDRVVLFDTKPLREIAQVIETADLGVVPKRKENFGNEAFSTKIFEFMAMEIPVIVSDTRIDKYYFDDSLVRFFRSGDDEDLARCMLDLIQHPEKRRSLVEHATEFIERNDWTAKKQEYLDLVGQLTDQSER